MFTGIVKDIGQVIAYESQRITIMAPSIGDSLVPGGSIAVNGVCLTATTAANDGRLSCDVSPQTLRRSNLGDLKNGSKVNLELPLRSGSAIDGHLLQGHIDDTGVLVDSVPESNSLVRWVKASSNIIKLTAELGSVGIDGVSLTITAVKGKRFAVSLIPMTLQLTILGDKRDGEKVNIEVDILAKYVAKFLQGNNSDY